MATVDLSNSEKLAILKNAKVSTFSSLAQICYQIGIDPFTLDIDNFNATDEQKSIVGNNLTTMVNTLKGIISSIKDLEDSMVE